MALGVVCLAVPSRGQGSAPPPAEAPEAPSPPGEEGEQRAPEKSDGPRTPAAGYAYSDKRARSSQAPRRRYRKTGPVVNMPGFEQLPDGGSRLFVQLSESVPVEERKARGTLTYVLKGASPRVWNNTNPLVTVHFNTPVSRARLVPHGKDLWFVVELRAAVEPTWKMSEAPERGAVLTIDFPRGDYLDAQGAAAPSAAEGRGKPRGGAGQTTAPPRGSAKAP